MSKFLAEGRRLLDGNTFTFSSGARQTLQLPVPSTFIKKLYLWLRFTLTISAVTTAGVVHADGPVNLIQQIELRVDGDPIKVGLGAHFFRLAQLLDVTPGVNNGLSSAAAGVYNCEALVPIYFIQPASVGPFDTILDGRAYRNMILNLTWGTTADLIVGNTSTLAVSNATCQVYIEETDPFPMQGGAPYLFRQSETTFANILTNTGSRLLLPYQQNSVVRMLLLKAIDGSNLSDAIINSLQLRINGGEAIPFQDLEDDFLQALTQHDFSQITMPDGYYVLNFAQGGRILTTGLGAKLRPGELNTLEIIANTTVGSGATSIIAHLAELAPPVGAR